MKDEIKEILDKCTPFLFGDEVDKLTNYITNLQEEKDSIDDYARHLHNENKSLQEENERLKKELNALRISEEEWLNETLGGDEE